MHFAAYKQWPKLRIVQEYNDLPLYFMRNQHNEINLNTTYMVFVPRGAIISQESTDKIIETIRQNPNGYMYLWNDNCLVLKCEFIKRYDININHSIYGLSRIGQVILSYIQTIDCCKRIFTFKENLITD